jgi:hypothetical protein
MPISEERRMVLENIKLKINMILNDMIVFENRLKDLNNDLHVEYRRIVERHWSAVDVQDAKLRESIVIVELPQNLEVHEFNLVEDDDPDVVRMDDYLLLQLHIRIVLENIEEELEWV